MINHPEKIQTDPWNVWFSYSLIFVYPFDLIFFYINKYYFLQRELVLKAKEIFVVHGPWLVHGSLEKLKVRGHI